MLPLEFVRMRKSGQNVFPVKVVTLGSPGKRLHNALLSISIES